MKHFECFKNQVEYGIPISDSHRRIVRPKNQKFNVFLNAGFTGQNQCSLFKFVNNFFNDKSTIIYLAQRDYEKCVARYGLLENIKKFEFKQSDYISIDLLIGRAGLGLITTNIEYQIPSLFLAEALQPEIIWNIKKSRELGIGWEFNPNKFKLVKEFILSGHKKFRQSYSGNLKKLNKNGINKIINEICTQNEQ